MRTKKMISELEFIHKLIKELKIIKKDVERLLIRLEVKRRNMQ